MFDPEALRIVRNRLDAELPRRRQLFEAELQRVQGDMATRGLARSGALIQAIADVCAQEVESSAARLWEVILPLLEDTEGTPSEDAVRAIHGQVDELLFPLYCAAAPHGQFAAICGRVGFRAPGDPTGFQSRVAGAHQRVHAEIDQLVRLLRRQSTIPASTWGYWKFVLRRAYRESDFNNWWKVVASVLALLISLLTQYEFGVRSWQLTVRSIAAGLTVYVVINLIGILAKAVSIPPKLMSRGQKRLSTIAPE